MTPAELLNEINAAGSGGTYYPTSTIQLPALTSSTQVITFDGAINGDIVTISDSLIVGTDTLITISPGNRGTYIFKNLILEAWDAIYIDEGYGTDSVIFENVTFKGNQYDDHLVAIDSQGTNLVVDSCEFSMSYDAAFEINVSKGTLDLRNSTIYGHYSGVVISTDGSVVIDNCYISTNGNAVAFHGYDKANLTIRDSTLHSELDGPSGYYLVDVMTATGTTGNSVVLQRSVFSTLHSNGAGLRVWGSGAGSVNVTQCQFIDLAHYREPSFMINLGGSSSFNITDSSFIHCMTPMWDGFIQPAIYMCASSGTIVNSTFWYNTIVGAYNEIGCIMIDSPDVDIISCTFFDNYCITDSGDFVAASLEQGYGSNVKLYNTILVTNIDDTTRTTPVWGNAVYDGGGNIIQVGGIEDIFAYNDTWPREEGNNGKYAGCSWNRQEVATIPILPGGDADGTGESYPGTPSVDQRGKTRANGAPDIGAVCIDSAAFYSNGGWWEPDYFYDGYCLNDPYVFSDPLTLGFDIMTATSENEDDKIRLPDGYQYMLYHSTDRFLGWSLTEGPGLPDMGYVYFWDSILVDLADTDYEIGEFEVDEKYFAKWGEDFLVLYVPGDGVTPVLQPWGTPAPSISKGNAFVSGWTMDLLGSSPWDPTSPPDGNIVVYGIWLTDPPIMTVTVEFRDGAKSTTVTIPVGGMVSKPADPVREGAVFLGWFTAQEGGSEWDFSTYITSNLVLYAQWQGMVFYVVTFDPCNGDAVTKIEVEKDKPSPVPKVIPTKPDHAFQGWYTAATGGTLWDFTTPITENTTLYGQWGPITENSVIFYPQNGDPPIIVELNLGATFALPQDPTMKGYKFLGWFTDPEGGTKWDSSMPLTPGMKLYAHWEEASDGGWMEGEETVIVVIVVVVGIVASLGIIPVAVAGGAISTQVATANVFQQGMLADMHGEDRSGEEKNRRTVIFDPKNGKSAWASSVMGGRQVSQPGAPKPPKGMAFSHWSESPEGGAPFSFMTPINKNTHLYAIYVKKD